MKVARLAVLGVALVAGAAAAWLATGSPPPEPVQQIVQAAPEVPTDEVLVAAKELPLGTLIGQQDMSWQVWPRASVSAGMIRKSETPKAIDDLAGSVSRGNFFQGEPMRKDKLVKGPSSGYLSAMLPAGYRAVAITIDQQGGTTAGGFILPNDRVDVIRTVRDQDVSKATGTDVFTSEVILSNVRVLAIGQQVQEKNGERVVTGATATLELDPRQAETVILNQRVGQLSLALRSMLDAAKGKEEPVRDSGRDGVTIVRYGVATQAVNK